MKLILMNEHQDYFDAVDEYKPDCIVFTSNGLVNRDSELIMGRGVALSFKNKFGWLPYYIGSGLKTGRYKSKNSIYRYHSFGPIPQDSGPDIFAVQTKLHWRDKSDIAFIEESVEKLVSDTSEYNRILLPCPGCENGGLAITDIGHILSTLDDRFIVLQRGVNENFNERKFN